MPGIIKYQTDQKLEVGCMYSTIAYCRTQNLRLSYSLMLISTLASPTNTSSSDDKDFVMK